MRKCVQAELTLFLVLFAASASAFGGAPKRQFLNRSIYVPVAFRLCGHLKQGILYIGDIAVAHLPSERIFQFTYYPDLDRLEPPFTEVRIEGVDTQALPFLARLAVSPLQISTSHERIDLDMEHQLKKFSFKRDIRYHRVDLLVRCSSSCRAPQAVEGSGGPSSTTTEEVDEALEAGPLTTRY